MKTIQIINNELLDEVSSSAKNSSRRRKNYNFHRSDTDSSHRLLNAMEPDSYIPPHCHKDASKDETIVVLRGKFGVVFFDVSGKVTKIAKLTTNGEAVGVNIPHGEFHTLVALESGSVFLESKAGPYQPLCPEEKVQWAPQEGDSEASAYLSQLKALFGA